MGNPLQASNSRSMGNYGLWETLRHAPDGYDAEDEDFGAAEPHVRSPLWLRLRGRVIRWSLAAGGFFAYINHWPGGH